MPVQRPCVCEAEPFSFPLKVQALIKHFDCFEYRENQCRPRGKTPPVPQHNRSMGCFGFLGCAGAGAGSGSGGGPRGSCGYVLVSYEDGVERLPLWPGCNVLGNADARPKEVQKLAPWKHDAQKELEQLQKATVKEWQAAMPHAKVHGKLQGLCFQFRKDRRAVDLYLQLSMPRVLLACHVDIAWALHMSCFTTTASILPARRRVCAGHQRSLPRTHLDGGGARPLGLLCAAPSRWHLPAASWQGQHG